MLARADKGAAAAPMRLLVTLDENYLPRLRVLLTSVALNNPGEAVELYLMHRGISEDGLQGLERQCVRLGFTLFPVRVDSALFRHAPVTKLYPQEMYYRLLAPRLLPAYLQKILYLDPDILVINPLRPLWETELEGRLFAAASHTGMAEIATGVNRIRLGTDSDYFNSGVLLINLEAGREEIVPEEVFAFAAERGAGLLLPDQDILNAMYGSRILPLDDSLWNYDARNYSSYLLRTSGKTDMNWVMSNTAILHFCGRAKPWKPGYPHRFGILYQHYEQLTNRWFPGQAPAAP